MGEYFAFVNHDKKQIIDPINFDIVNIKAHGSMKKNTDFLCAFYSLLAHEWANDRIEWNGDESSDYDDGTFLNVGAIFKSAESDEIKTEMKWDLEELEMEGDNYDGWNEFGVTRENIDSFFYRNGENYKYVINHTKKVAYCLDYTKILSIKGEVLDWVDPITLLIGNSRSLEKGEWVGDIIGVSNELDQSITLLEEITID